MKRIIYNLRSTLNRLEADWAVEFRRSCYQSSNAIFKEIEEYRKAISILEKAESNTGS